jgi:uncharacterized protein (TIGR00255 family)
LLLSMTGFGEAHAQRDELAISVEVRCVNSRYLKLSTRLTEGYSSLEPQVEALLRKRIRRGTIQVNVRLNRDKSPDDYRINAEVFSSYRKQIDSIQEELGTSRPIELESLLLLPGVVSEDAGRLTNAAESWPLVHDTLEVALSNLDEMRSNEGRAMAEDLKANLQAVTASLDEVQTRAPLVAEAYRERLTERLNKIIAEHGIALDPSDVIKEVGLFADRSDISEEIVRLRSHVEQFTAIMEMSASSGRKLEFLTQEMVREGNTIGSKANDVEIARHVIEIKTAIERIREMIQNVE